MTFALITEGVSEHRVVKHILTKYFKEEEPLINQIQPKLLNDKQESGGGWAEVLKYCGREELKDIFVENDYLVIQIDTDQCETAPFSISHTKAGTTQKTNGELHSEVVEKIESLILPEIREAYREKIFFAVSIHTIECWLLPIYFTSKHKSAERNCLAILNKELTRLNKDGIPAKDKNNTNAVRAYSKILQEWKKKQDIIDASQHNQAFKLFVESLEAVVKAN